MKANIGIKQESISKVVEVLTKVLADEFVLYTKTKKAHWNVEGPDFTTNTFSSNSNMKHSTKL